MNILDRALRNALRTLKLTGILETLDARLAQTRNGGLGHLDFLQVLCEDEIARRESAALTRRIRRARFEEQSTFESFDFTVNTKLPAAMLRDLSALRWLDAAESVILYGPVGVGKTHMAQALGRPWPDAAQTCGSPKPPACSPIWLAATLIAPGANASANTPNRWC
jgi:DNA replication protein DnaC